MPPADVDVHLSSNKDLSWDLEMRRLQQMKWRREQALQQMEQLAKTEWPKLQCLGAVTTMLVIHVDVSQNGNNQETYLKSLVGLSCVLTKNWVAAFRKQRYYMSKKRMGNRESEFVAMST